MTKPKKRQPLGQSIGGVLFGFEQQVFRNQPPPHELVHHARPDAPVPTGNGTMLTIELPEEDQMPDQDPGRRLPPAGFPTDFPSPPVIAEPGDPFSSLRVIDAVARMERGQPVRLDDFVDRLNATYLDWLFTRRVVMDVLVALQSNWMADYRNASGIVLVDGDRGPEVTLEDSSRVDPWIVGQAERALAACRQALDEFARQDRPVKGG